VTLTIDIAAVVIIFANCVFGWRYGIVGRMIAFAGLYAGVAGASFLGNGIAHYFHGRGNPDDLYAAGWTFVIILGVIVVLVEILGVLYGDRVRSITSLAFDRTAGLIAGGVVGFLEIAVVCLVALSVGNTQPAAGQQNLPGDRGKVASAVNDGLVGGRIASVEPGIKDLFKPALPTDLSSHLAELTSP
jgi:uncharacterized membrane protein required for colicin V production